MEAQITVSGNVGAAVTYRQVEGYGGAASFSLAFTPRVRREGKWDDGETLWFRVQCWRSLAAHVRDSIERGDAVVVTGRLRAETWHDRNGVEHQELIIEAKTIGHDLNRGASTFTRARRQPLEPQQETAAEADLARWEDELHERDDEAPDADPQPDEGWQAPEESEVPTSDAVPVP